MQKTFVTNLLITLITNLLVKPFWIFGIDRTIQNRVGVENYGAYANLFTFSLVLSVLLDLGINNYNTSTLARNANKLSNQFIPLLFIKFLCGLLYVLLTVILGSWYGFSEHQLWLVFLLAVNQLLAHISTFFRSTLTGLQQYRAEAVISATDRLVMSIAGVSLLLFTILPISIQSFIYIQTVGYASAVIISFIVLLPALKKLSFTIQLPRLTSIFRQALPFALLALLMMLYSKLDVLLIKKLMQNADQENGIYAQGLRLVDAANMFGAMIAGLLLPMYANIIRKKNELSSLIQVGLFAMLTPIIVIVVFVIFNATQVIEILYHQYTNYSLEVFRWAVLTIIPTGVIGIFGTLLTAKSNMKVLLITSALGLVLNLSLNLYLIPQFGAWGSAVSAVGTLTFVAFIYVIVSIQQMQLDTMVSLLFRYFWFGILNAAVILTCQKLGLHFIVSTICYGLSAIAFVFLLRIISVAQLKKFSISFTNKI